MFATTTSSCSLVLFLLVSIQSMLLVAGNKCPPAESIMPCRCRGRNDQVQVWCSHSDLERVNGALENLMRLRNMPAIDELIVENNRMPTLPARAFGALQIGRLLLRNNGLEGFSRNAFAGLEDSLEEMYIVEEKLVDFPFDAIEKLRNLEAFTLEKSRVRLLPRFNGLNRLKHIRIDGSLISGFPVGAFANMASVKQIHVVNSDVTTLAEGIFGRLENLILANFSNNRIDHIQRRCFALLPRLEILSVANNHLEEAMPVGRAVEELISLKSLDLSNNRFRQLPEGSFVNLRTLQSLTLAGNRISRVAMRSFTHLPALRKVDLSFNELKTFPKMFFDTTPLLEEIRLRSNQLGSAKEIGEMLETLKSLRYLDIGANGLSELPTGAIKGHTHLMKLDLSDNKILRIQREAFKDVPSLTEMSLRNNSLTELPVDGLAWDIASLKELDLSMNKLTAMSMNALQGLPNLARMDLSHNGIKSLGQGVFLKNKEMDYLDIADNALSIISADAFQGLQKLTRLDLSKNHLESVPSGAFRDLKSIQGLTLANNRINNVPANMLHELRSLEELSLKSNSISHVPAGFFQNLAKLKQLNLRDNSIGSIQNKMFSGLPSLETLRLASNKISHFDENVFDDMINLKSLDLSSNRVTRLPSRSFKNLPSLERFEARENRISTVENGVLGNSEGLQILDLAHNALTQVPELIKSHTLLKVIDFSHNQISKVDVDNFRHASNLMELYLNDNKIKQIQPKTFENLGSLTIVDLDGNELEDIKTGTFHNLPRLIYLRLSRNKLRNVQNLAFSGLSALDGLDLQENEIEQVAETAFEKTGALKYLNFSNNIFDSISKMGLGPLSSLEVLDMSFNKLSGVDAKALRHLIWLVELRMNDNGICTIPTGTFDVMSRLKMLVLKNNSLAHLYESVFYKLRNNIAFIDVSGNPLSCDCEMIWLRNLMAREAIQELTESVCEGPNELQGTRLKSARPGRMICNGGATGRSFTGSNSISEAKCPPVTKSMRKPRPHAVEVDGNNNNGHPLFSSNGYPEASQNELRHNTRRKEDKLIESNDYIPGDTPTIYAGSSTTNANTKATHEDVRKSSNSVFGGLSSLFGIPLDFGLNLGISPSVSVTDKSTGRHGGHISKNGFSVDGSRKGADPLPPAWIERPSKPAVYEPPEYLPRKPIQPYIPLNPYRDQGQSSPPVIPSSSVDVHKAVVSPNGIGNEKDSLGNNLNGRRNKKPPIVKFPTSGPNAAPPPPPSWHPSYPNTETGFIPIEPFFHSNSFSPAPARNNKNNNNVYSSSSSSSKSKNDTKNKADWESSGSNVQYFSSTTPPPRTQASFVHHQQSNTLISTSTSSSSTSSSSSSNNSPKKTGSESGYRSHPLNKFANSHTDSSSSKGKSSASSTSSSQQSTDSEEYGEEEVANYTPVNIQSPDDEKPNKDPSDDLSLTDFWDIFTGQPIRKPNSDSSRVKGSSSNRDPSPSYYDDRDSPVNFSNPIDATTFRSIIQTPEPYHTDEVRDDSIITGYDSNGVIRRATGKPTITKIIEQGFKGTGGSDYLGPDNPISNEIDGPVKPEVDQQVPHHHNHHHSQSSSQPSPSPLVPPVVIGTKHSEPADWYYTNYNNGEAAAGAGTEEWEKLIERSHIKQLEEELIGAKRSGSSSRNKFSSYHHYCLVSLMYYILVYMNP